MRVHPEIVEAARSGGKPLDDLIADIWPQAYRLAFGITRDHGLAEDAAQDACTAIALRLGSLRTPSAFTAWSCKIITSHALDIVRRRRPDASIDESISLASTFDVNGGLELSEAFSTLAPRKRAILLLHYYAGLTSIEIGIALCIAPVTVRFHLMQARATLRKALAANDSPPLHEVFSDVR